MKVILAEKPSVAKTIASFLKANTRRDGYFEGNGYIVTYAFGHLVSLYDMKDYDKEKYSGSWKMANFPFIPADKFKFKVDDSKQKQFNIIKELLNRDDVEYVINATDNDREGELIAFLIFLLAKNKKPVKRILVNEWTPQDITRGLENLKDEEDMRNLQAAGYTRLITDWLIGINFTSVATLKYGNGKLLNIGRVILPTVKLVYDRDMEIRNFIPKTYFEIEGNFKFKSISHRDYLGALLNLGIKREKIGDIIIHDNFCQVVVSEDICDFIIINLEKVSKNKVKVKEITVKDIIESEQNFKEISFTVSCLRLDSVIGGVYNLSRSESLKLIKGEKVHVDYEKIISPSKEIKTNSLISVRGHGRAIIEIGDMTKKGRIKIRAKIII